MVGQTVVVFLLVFANGFFVAAEFALVKVRLSQIENLARQGMWSARLARSVLNNIDAYLSACQLGITLASLALGWLGEHVMQTLLEPIVEAIGAPAETARYIAIPVAFLVITFLHITLGEQAPKILAIRSARATTLVTAPPLMVFFKIFWPLIWVLNAASNLLLRLIGINVADGESHKHTEEELRLILAESADGGELSRRERLMMENVLDLENKVARQIMVPRRDIILLNTRKPLDENLRTVTESRHTRFPLCDGELDRIVGMVHSKDLLREISDRNTLSLVDICRKLPFFPETMRLDVLLREFQRNRTHVAMLVDEYGTVSGMVTFENVLEELVGPIQDEFDREPPQVMRRGKGKFIVDGLCPVTTLVDEIGIELPDDLEADTTGGAVVELMGHIPEDGAKLRVGSFELTVVQAEPTRVRRVEFQRLDLPDGSDSGMEPRHRNGSNSAAQHDDSADRESASDASHGAA